MLLRPSPGRFEVYMARRSTGSAFAPDAFVFPGGTVDRADRAQPARERTIGLDPARLTREFRASRMPGETPALDFDLHAAIAIAALRELFEEAGILIARDRAGDAVDAEQLAGVDAETARHAIRDGTRTFDDFLRAPDWLADATAIAHFSRWVTPTSEPRRYDTHFFVAVAPRDQAALADERETHDGVWIAPADALAQHRAGRFHLVYPTVKHLERLTAFDAIDDLLAFARSKPIVTVAPEAHPDDGYVMPSALEAQW